MIPTIFFLIILINDFDNNFVQYVAYRICPYLFTSFAQKFYSGLVFTFVYNFCSQLINTSNVFNCWSQLMFQTCNTDFLLRTFVHRFGSQLLFTKISSNFCIQFSSIHSNVQSFCSKLFFEDFVHDL